MITVYGIKNCDSVKKARKWLEAQNCDYQFHDFRADGLDPALLEGWLKRCDWNTLLNRRSTSWKQLDAKRRESVDKSNIVQLLVEVPTLIKRPVIVKGQQILVGFNAEDYCGQLL